jgi:hypothetical protein
VRCDNRDVPATVPLTVRAEIYHATPERMATVRAGHLIDRWAAELPPAG